MPTPGHPSSASSRAIPRTGASTTSAPPTHSAITTLGRPIRSAGSYTGPAYPFGNQYSAPRAAPVFAAPAPRAPRWVHGYWGQQWVPQYYTYDAWIPGYFAGNGAWIQGRYEPRTAESGGYYERVWVEGYWTE